MKSHFLTIFIEISTWSQFPIEISTFCHFAPPSPHCQKASSKLQLHVPISQRHHLQPSTALSPPLQGALQSATASPHQTTTSQSPQNQYNHHYTQTRTEHAPILPRLPHTSSLHFPFKPALSLRFPTFLVTFSSPNNRAPPSAHHYKASSKLQLLPLIWHADKKRTRAETARRPPRTRHTHPAYISPSNLRFLCVFLHFSWFSPL